ncbi:MAG: IS21-like element helper ATPase IstB [Acidithiobacillus sp.]
MYTHPTYDRLRTLHLSGMLHALEHQEQHPEITAMPFLERLGILLDAEWSLRDQKRLQSRLRAARLKQPATLEDLDWQGSRRFDRSLLQSLTSDEWIRQHRNVLVLGPTGVGKTYIACALGHQACRDGYHVLYQRLPRLLADLEIAHADGRYPKLLQRLAKIDVLVLDDWGLETLTDRSRHDLLEILDDRYQTGSTLVTSQLPVEHWHDSIGDPTLADAILDRLIHNAYRLTIDGESMRKKQRLTPSAQSA